MQHFSLQVPYKWVTLSLKTLDKIMYVQGPVSGRIVSPDPLTTQDQITMEEFYGSEGDEENRIIDQEEWRIIHCLREISFPNCTVLFLQF